MNPRFQGLVLGASLSASSFVPGVAFADEATRAPTRLWVESSSSEKACVDATAAIAKELVLACDASRAACNVAKTRESATRTLLLRCGADAAATAEGGSEWALTAHDTDGTQRWTMNLFGADADLPRSAAMFAVRFETGAEPLPAKKTLPDAAAAAAPVTARRPESKPSESSSSAGKWLTYGGFGAGAVGLGLGTVLALAARSKQSSLEDLCKPSCSSDDAASLRRQYTAANIILGVGAAGVVTGIVGAILWANTPSSRDTRGKSVSTVRATAGLGGIGLAGSF